MDKLQKLYVEKHDPAIRINTIVEDIIKYMGQSSNRLLALELSLEDVGHSELAKYSKDLMESQLKLMTSLKNHVEQYYPTVFTKK